MNLKFLTMGLLGLVTSHVHSSPMKLEYSDLPKNLENNRSVQGAKLAEQAAQARRLSPLELYSPSIVAEGGAESFTHPVLPRQVQPYGQLRAELNVFNGSRDSARQAQRGFEAKAATLESSLEYQSQLKASRNLFWRNLFAQEKLKLLQEAMALNQKNFGMARKRISAGVAGRSDEAEFEYQSSHLMQSFEEMKAFEEGSRKELATLLGLSEQKGIEVTGQLKSQRPTAAPRSPDSEGGFLESSRLEVLAKAKAEEARIFSRAYFPSLDLYSAYSLYTTQDRDWERRADRAELSAGVKVQIPLLDGTRFSEAKAARLESQALELKARQSQLELTEKESLLRNRILVSERQILLAEQGVAQSRRYLTLTQEDYQRGIKNSPDLLSASQKFFEAEAGLLELYLGYQDLHSELEFLTSR